MHFKELLELINIFCKISIFFEGEWVEGYLENENFYLSLEKLYNKKVTMISNSESAIEIYLR